MLFQTMSQLGDTFQGIIKISNGSVQVLAPQHIRGPLIDRLAWTAAFHQKVEMRGTARWLIKMFAAPFGIALSENVALQTLSSASDPKIQIEGMSYPIAQMLFRPNIQHPIKTFVLINDSEKNKARDMASITAAAIQENFQGHLIFQKRDLATPAIVLETRVQVLQENKARDILITENTEKNTRHISISVFSAGKIEQEKQEAFLWQLAPKQEEEISCKIANIIEFYLKKYNHLDLLPMVQSRNSPLTQSFALRDEIAAAIAEPDTGQQQSFSKSFSGLKTKV